MGLSKGVANQGKKTHYSKPSSALSKHNAYVKPESRELGTKAGSPEKANAILRKAF